MAEKAVASAKKMAMTRNGPIKNLTKMSIAVRGKEVN